MASPSLEHCRDMNRNGRIFVASLASLTIESSRSRWLPEGDRCTVRVHVALPCTAGRRQHPTQTLHGLLSSCHCVFLANRGAGESNLLYSIRKEVVGKIDGDTPPTGRPSDHRLTCLPIFNTVNNPTAAAIAQHALEVSGEHGDAFDG